ncbi:leucyl/phenylalanyl-tRNA--protein transferase [Pseudidiomarina andamanensis]|uniref:leucyl/phenylalanyl-tRNA--protein transferase n=1 Tax=Pseudidiomarina andamanensis TaxID=1940690 RepID=UPI001C12A3B6|nr:leucyl/phenylalanyl-tRNA--protein transferase [Pseudidiomarina andamanensis]MDS0218368.1 leucyl/phenylalanyl-tRNA--protein transferase [Pseudidiomarina andamanensis]
MLFELTTDSVWFPSPEFALREPDGLLAFGGDLSPERLIEAYNHGIFPWYSSEDPILWWSPNPRTIFTAESLHVSRSMKRFLKHTDFQVTLNNAFNEVIKACADVHEQANRGVWIHPEMQAAYNVLHQLGHAHSVEVWHDSQLVGGLYGIGVGNIFCAESMFHTQTNASKAALLIFAQEFFDAGGELIDAQIRNEHTASLGAHDISRQQYLHKLHTQKNTLRTNFWTPTCLKA